jgi:hypothetical protein
MTRLRSWPISTPAQAGGTIDHVANLRSYGL